MNVFNQKAAEAGRAFIQNYPRATGVQIDEASPKFNPARRHFQDAAHELQKQIRDLGKTFYRWEVVTVNADRVVGFCKDADEAVTEVKLTIKLLTQDGKKIAHYQTENQDGTVLVGVYNRKP
jgi:hypothetical protein